MGLGFSFFSNRHLLRPIRKTGKMEEASVVAVDNQKPHQEKPHTDVLLFNRWSYDDVQVCLFPFQFYSSPVPISFHYLPNINVELDETWHFRNHKMNI